MRWDGHEQGEHRRTHSFSGTPTYRVWQGMKQRCLNPANPRWSSYGGAGIKIDPRWLVFENFLADMGKRPNGKTLDRFPNPFGDYVKTNCRWATPVEQQNNMRNSRRLTYNGRTATLPEWAKKLGLNVSTLAKRLRRGFTVEEALTKTVTKTRRPYRQG